MTLNITLREASTDDILSCSQIGSSSSSDSKKKIQPLTSAKDLLKMVPGDIDISKPVVDPRDIPPPKIMDVPKIGSFKGEVVLKPCQIPRIEETVPIGNAETSSQRKVGTVSVRATTVGTTSVGTSVSTVTATSVETSVSTVTATRTVSGKEVKKFQVLTYDVMTYRRNNRINITFSEELKYKEELNFFEIDPVIDGDQYWVGKKTLVFSPSQRFAQSTSFKCKIKKGILSKTGKRLPEDYTFTFATSRISINDFIPNTRTKLHSTVPLFLSFSQRIDHEKVFPLLKLTSRLSVQDIPLKILNRDEIEPRLEKLRTISFSLYKSYMYEFEHYDPGKSIWFSSEEELNLSTSYTLSFLGELTSLEGPLTRDVDREYQFSTFPQFSVMGASRDVLPLQRFRVWFNNKIDRSTLDPQKMIKVVPAIPDLEIVPTEKSLYFSGKTEGNTLYNITIKKGVKDVHGVSMKKSKKVRVNVTRAAQTLQAFRSGVVVLDPTHPQSTCFSLVVCNIKSLRMTVFKVSPKDFMKSPFGDDHDEDWIRKRRGVTKTINCNITPDNPTEVNIDLLPYLQHKKEKVGHIFLVIKPVKTKDSEYSEEVMAWVQVTKLAFDMFTSHDGKLYAYSNSLDTGRVVEKARFTFIPWNLKMKPIRMDTNEFGLVCLEPKEMKISEYDGLVDGLLVCSRGKDSVFTQSLPRIKGKPVDKLLHFIFDDRKLYKPKEEIHIKGFFRNLIREGPIYRIEKIDDTEVNFKVVDGRKEEFLSSTTNVVDGSCHVFFRIPEKPNLGTFTITFEISKDRTVSHTFKVEMFRTPEFFVKCSSDQSYYIVKDDFVVKSLASYYSGGPLGDSSCEWVASQKRSFYKPPGKRKYNFSCEVDSYTQLVRGDVKFKGTSNIDGEHNICVSSIYAPSLSQEEKYLPVSVNMCCHVQDLNKQTISGQKKITVHPSGFYIGVYCSTVYESVGNKVTSKVVVTNIEGQVQKDVKFSVQVLRRENVNLWTKTYRFKRAYNFESESPEKEIELSFPNDGSHRLVFKVFDSKNRSHACSHRIHIFDPNKKYRSRDLDSSFDLGKNISKQNIMLLPNKTKFNVGETCRLLIDVNPLTPPITSYLHIYADGLVRKEVIVMNSQTEIYDLKIFREYVPNISVELYCVGKLESAISENKTNTRPAYASKKIDLSITLEHSELAVVLKPQSEVVSPGTSTTVNIKVSPKLVSTTEHDEVESFENALLTVIVVDEAVLNLAGYRIKSPIQKFFPSHDTSSSDLSTRREVFLKKWEDIQLKPPAPPTVNEWEERRHRHYSVIPMVEMSVTEHPSERVRNVFKVAPSTPGYRPIPPRVQVLTVQIGQCGNQMGEEFWNTLMKEHDLDERGRFVEGVREGNDGMGIYFRELSKTRYRSEKAPRFYPRALLIDTDPACIDGIRSRRLGRVFKPENCISSSLPTGNNWATGHYTTGAEMVDFCMDATRRELEDMDSFDGFHLFHSIGGGTGGGLGTLMLSKLREEFPDRMASTVTVFPSVSKYPGAAVEPYNATLSVHHLVENADMTFLYHNRSLYDACKLLLGEQQPKFLSINSIVARSLSDVTSSFRYAGFLNSNMRKMAVNLVPFPRLHFFGIHTSPIDAYAHYTYPNVRDVTSKLFHPSHCLTGYHPGHGRYTAVSAIYRGGGSQAVIEGELLNVQNKNSSYFVEWIPNNCSVSMIPYTRDNRGQISAALISNSTSIQEPLKCLSEYFTAMFRRKAFLHWYTGEGMDEMEFTEAESNMNDLISEYQQYQDATADEDGEFEEEEEGEGWEGDEMGEPMDDGDGGLEPEKAVVKKKKRAMKSQSRKRESSKSEKKKNVEEDGKKKKEEGEKKEIKVRKDFRALAAYVDQVKPDSAGVVDVPITVPDNLTRFRVTVLANRGNEQFGLGETVIRTNLPFTIKPSPPRFVRLSDVFICPVVIQNQHSKPVNVRVAVQSSSNFNTPEVGFMVEKLGSKERVVLPVQVRVDELGPGEGKLRFVGEAQVVGETNSFVDAVEKKIPIQLPHTVERFAVSGWLKKEESRVVQPIEFDNGTTLLPNETNCFFRVSTSAVSCLADSYVYVNNYKFMCCEQTSSQILSLISLLDIRDRFYTPPKEEEETKKRSKRRKRRSKKKKKRKKYGSVLPTPDEIKENVKTGLISLVKKQGISGGFGFWGRSSMHPTATTHAGLAVMRCLERDDPIITLPPMMLKKLVDCLSQFKSLLKKDKYLSGRTTDELVALSLFLLSIYHKSKKMNVSDGKRVLGKNEVARNVLQLLKKKNSTFPTRCYCVLALSKLGRKKYDEQIEKEVENLVMFVQQEKNTAFVVEKFKEDEYNSKLIALASNGKINALLLEVLAVTGIEEYENISHKIARYLLNKRGKKNSRWSNTHLCCHCNMALNKYYLRYEKDSSGISEFLMGFDNSHVKVELETPKKCEHAATISLGIFDKKQQQKQEEEEEGESDDDDEKKNRVMALIQRTKGDSNLYYSMSFRYVIGNLITPKVDDRGFSVKRVYHPVDFDNRVSVKRDKIKNEWVVQNGSIIKVEIVMYATSTRYHVALVDYLPAGFEILNPEFSVVPKKGGRFRSVWYSHQNMRDDSIEVFSEQVSMGVSYYVYFARATACGRFLVNPAYAEEMYDPEVFGRTETDYVRIVNDV